MKPEKKRLKKIEERIKRESHFWERFPELKGNGVAYLAYTLITRSEAEDFEYLTLKRIAKNLKVSESYLSRCLKKFCSLSFHSLKIQRRMQLAKELLVKSPRLSMDGVAKKLCYSTGNYFIKVFKKECKMTPAQYRKKTIKENKEFAKIKRKVRELGKNKGIRVPKSTV